MKRLAFLCCWLWSLAALCGEVIPPVPAKYFNDYANVVPTATVAQLNTKLRDFERSTGNQIRVAIYPNMQSDSSIDDYAVRVARAWKVGQEPKNNGAALFVFIQDRQMSLQVGYGLEGVLPDALCKQIIEFEIKPHFKKDDYAGGMTAGVDAILAATRNEYKGTGRTVFESHASGGQDISPDFIRQVILLIFIIVVFVLVMLAIAGSRRPGRHGWVFSSSGFEGFSGGGISSSGGSSSSESFSSGGGDFSSDNAMSGGGSFGGGGASSSW